MDANEAQGIPDCFPSMAGYEVVRRLGGGSQGSVWLVQPRDGSPPLAAKCFLAGRHNESEITQEWRILANYDHDHLLAVRGVVELSGEWQGGRALLTDFAGGGSLQDIVAAKGPLTVGEAVTVLTPLGQVLSYLHGCGVVHGDVAPGNVLLTAHGKPVLADLGFGRLVGQPHDAQAGTPGFVGRLDGLLSAESDVFAMAAVGWFALTGHPPPATRDRMPLSMHVPGVPAELAAALEAGLAESAEQRPTAAAFAQAVFRSARAEPVALSEAVHPSVLPELLTRRAPRTPPRLSIPGTRTLGRLLDAARRRRDAAGARRTARSAGTTHAARSAGTMHAARSAGTMHAARSAGTMHAARTVRYLLAAAAAAVLVLGAGLAGWRLAAGDGMPFPAAGPVAGSGMPATASDAPGPGGVPRQLPAEIRDALASREPDVALPALAWVRSYALSSREFVLLEAVNAAGSPAMAADAAIVRDLEASRHTFSGLETTVDGAAVTDRKQPAGGTGALSATAIVSATVTTMPFAEHDAEGNVVYRHEVKQVQALSIVLMNVNGHWLIREILPASPASVAKIRK